MSWGNLTNENGRRNAMNNREPRFENAPDWLMWVMTFINRIGFPIAVALYLGYMQLNALPKVVEALNAVNGTLIQVKDVLQKNNEVVGEIRHRYGRRSPD